MGALTGATDAVVKVGSEKNGAGCVPGCMYSALEVAATKPNVIAAKIAVESGALNARINAQVAPLPVEESNAIPTAAGSEEIAANVNVRLFFALAIIYPVSVQFLHAMA